MARFLERLATIGLLLLLLATILIVHRKWKLHPKQQRLVVTRKFSPARRSDVSVGANGGVVRIIHQSWKTKKLPPMFKRWYDSFDTCMPNFEHRLWTDEDNRRLIAEHYAWFLPRYDSYGASVQKADVSRLFYMHHFGGVYCDLDCDCIRGFEQMLANTSLAFGAMKGTMIPNPSNPLYVQEGQIENSFMYSRPGHPFFWELIQELNRTIQGMPIMTTGPYLIMSGIHSTRKRGLDKTKFDGLPYLTVYPPHLFNPFSWISNSNSHCRVFGAFSADSLRRCRESHADSFVVQYHTQVWDKGKRNVLV